MREIIELKITNNLIKDYLPTYSTAGSAGMDIHACIEKSVIVKSGHQVIIPTGIIHKRQ